MRKTTLLVIALVLTVIVRGELYGIPRQQPSSQGKHALLIGINTYTAPGMTSLYGPMNDVALMKEILMTVFQFKEENIIVLTEDKATHDGIEKGFKELIRRTQKGDFVYIHYSGHGSYTCDENGDEKENPSMGGKYDSTWVSYGARKGAAEGGKSECPKPSSKAPSTPSKQQPQDLNDYDVLDDEVDRWLAELSVKTDQIVLVSDSCHSGTITRGSDAFRTRAAPMMMASHPVGNLAPTKTLHSIVQISASRDDEKAIEFEVGNKKKHGLLTWHWAQSLRQATPGQSWTDVYNRTRVLMRDAVERSSQNPQIVGINQNKPIFGGEFSNDTRKAVVRFAGKTTAKIDQGTLLGVTKGSVYRKYSADQSGKQTQESATITITYADATWSEGEIKGGALKVGDLMVLEHYQHETNPIKVFVAADLDADKPVLEKIKKIVSDMPAFQVVSRQGESDLVIRVIRPKKDIKGKYLYKKEGDSLPQSFPEQDPECWIVTPAETPYSANLNISMRDQARSEALLTENLGKYIAARRLLALSQGPGQQSPVELDVTIIDEAKAGDSGEKVEVGGKIHVKERTVLVGDPKENIVSLSKKLIFSVRNTSDKPYYVYLINIAPDGSINPFYPTPDAGKEAGKVMPGQSRKIDEALLLDTAGREYVRLIASREPIDIYLLEQGKYRTRSEERMKSGMNSLETLLTGKAGLTRAKAVSVSTGSWATVQGSFMVGPAK